MAAINKQRELGSAVGGFDIVANTQFAFVTNEIYVGVTGNVHIRWASSQANQVFVAVPAGSTLKVKADMVWSTSTTATNLVGLY